MGGSTSTKVYEDYSRTCRGRPVSRKKFVAGLRQFGLDYDKDEDMLDFDVEP